MKKIVLLLIFLLIIPTILFAQEVKDTVKKDGISFWDKEDGYLDLSQFVLNAHGFIPIPVIITEPAVGGFGLGFFPVFIQQNKPVEKDGKLYPSQPDITVAGGGYTANDTWFVAGGRMGLIEKYGLKYKAFVAYANANLDFYQYVPELDNKELKFGFNMEAIPVYLYLAKQLLDPRWTIGIDYMFADIKLRPDFGLNVPADWIKDIKSIQSELGVLAEFDTRDNTFTPNKGIKLNLNAKFSSQILGSDFDYQQTEQAFYWFAKLTDKWVNGLRIDMQQVYGDAPFYMKPYVDMRGVPALKYQGDYTALIELEERYDIGKTNRWSVVAFGGLGKGFENADNFEDAPMVWSYGVGGRYLISRLLNIRVGMDVAMGPDGPAYYIIFGSSWGRQ